MCITDCVIEEMSSGNHCIESKNTDDQSSLQFVIVNKSLVNSMTLISKNYETLDEYV